MLADLRRQAWLRLAGRHIEMARLLVQTHADGGFFHVYHAYESLLCSELLRLAPAEGIPDGHREKFHRFMDLVGDDALAERVSELWEPLDRRNESLYVGWRRGRVREPHQLFTSPDIEQLLEEVSGLREEFSVRGPAP